VCPHNDKIAESRGCRGKPAPRIVQKEEVDNGEIHYYNCPKLFIPRSVIVWHKMYDYHKSFPGASMSGVDKQNARFLEAYYVYENATSEYKAIIEKNRKQ